MIAGGTISGTNQGNRPPTNAKPTSRRTITPSLARLPSSAIFYSTGGLTTCIPESEPADWLLLLQLDSGDNGAGMNWGDEGIYFMIHKDDPRRRRFRMST
jgi:hypothetical protein